MASHDNKIIFLHIPKNGGTAFQQALEKHFRRNEIHKWKKSAVDWYTAENKISGNIKEFLPDSVLSKFNDPRKIKLITGHQYFGTHEINNSQWKYVTFLREPASRIISFYNYVYDRPNHPYHQTLVNSYKTFEEFIINTKRLDVNNAQVRWISGLHSSEQTMLEKAKENIEKFFPVVGILESYRDSLLLIQHYYKLPVLENKKHNTSNKVICIKGISKEAYELIKSKNTADYALYKLMKIRLSEQMKGLSFLKKSNFIQHLIRFPNSLKLFRHIKSS